MIRILTVDNDPYTLKLFERLFQDKQIDLKTASSASDALRLFEENDFNLILMDQRLEDVNGLDVLRKMWKSRPQQLAILMTGYAENTESFRKTQARLFGYLSKPFKNLEEIERIIDKALELDHAYREIKDLRKALDLKKNL